jgi:hypothetical protein
MCMIPHQRLFGFAFFSYPTTKSLSGVLGRYDSGHTCITYFAKSKTGPQGDASHTLGSRRASVWNEIPNSNMFGTPLYHDSLFWMNAFWKVWAIFISFLFFLLFFRRTSKYPLFYSLDICPFFLSYPLAWIFSF